MLLSYSNNLVQYQIPLADTFDKSVIYLFENYIMTSTVYDRCVVLLD